MIDLDQLHQFLTVTQFMNFTKAANYLFISHSTISRNMAALEESLGVELFVRDNHAVRLTAAGELLKTKGERLLQTVELIEQEVRRADYQEKGRLVISSFNFYNEAVFQSYREFSRRWPGFDMAIHHKSLDEILPMVACGDADLGITMSFALEEDMSAYSVTPIQSGQFRVLVSSQHPLASLDSIDVHDPRLTDIIMLGQMDYDFVMKIGGDTSRERLNQKTAASLESLFMQIKAGMGIALVPEHAAAEAGIGCTQLKLDGVDSSYQVVLCQLKSNCNPAIDLFLDLYREVSLVDTPVSSLPDINPQLCAYQPSPLMI